MSVIFQRIILIVILLPICCLSSYVDRRNRYTLETEKGYAEKIKRICLENNFSVLLEITKDMFIVQYNGNGNGSAVLMRISDRHQNEILYWEPVRIYDNDLEPAEGIPTNSSSFIPGNDSEPLLVCKDYYGMHIEDVWNLNITGRGIIVAIIDAGINTDLLELKNRIDNSLSYNFEDASSDVTPEVFPNMTSECLEKTDHGNRIASVIVAEKGNNICSAGIAYNAKVAALKVFKVKCFSGKYIGNQADGKILAAAFNHEIDHDIDIYVNTWTPVNDFDSLDHATLGSIANGATTGRRNLGMIYLVPAGKAGNGLSNNIYTITVGCIGQFGDVPLDSNIDASVITSGLSYGNNINASYMVTASTGNKCITGFKGTSAATAQIAGIIALGMEANRHLRRRRILHLLVEASEHTGLRETNAFKRNAAGKYVHDRFGFGLLNALKFVTLAGLQVETPKLISNTISLEEKRQLNEGGNDISFCFDCDHNNPCVTCIEYVDVRFKLEIETAFTKISIISPGNTTSVLMAGTIEHKTEHNSTSIQFHFVSAHFWDELPFGNWKIGIDLQSQTKIRPTNILDITVSIHGTSMLFEEIDSCKINGHTRVEQNVNISFTGPQKIAHATTETAKNYKGQDYNTSLNEATKLTNEPTEKTKTNMDNDVKINNIIEIPPKQESDSSTIGLVSVVSVSTVVVVSIFVVFVHWCFKHRGSYRIPQRILEASVASLLSNSDDSTSYTHETTV